MDYSTIPFAMSIGFFRHTDAISGHTNILAYWDLGLRPFIVFAISLLLAWFGIKIMTWIRTCVSFIFRLSK